MAAPGLWPGHAWRAGRLIFPLTHPDGRLLNLHGRACPDAAGDAASGRHDTLSGPRGYFGAECLRGSGDEPVVVVEGAFDAPALRAAGVPRVVAVIGVNGWRWEWARDDAHLVLALDADAIGQARADELERDARVRDLRVGRLLPEAYGGEKDPAAAWATGRLVLPPGLA
ncbi:MAG TPA: toprim domain-containing protein [Candidatus Dormibacteraeota bacterium]|nr:toprim domain-containing protein [Candidatus Dormibacteraeota bacterium]